MLRPYKQSSFTKTVNLDESNKVPSHFFRILRTFLLLHNNIYINPLFSLYTTKSQQSILPRLVRCSKTHKVLETRPVIRLLL